MIRLGNIRGSTFPEVRGPIGNWRFSGAKLKEIGKLYGISGSGLNCSCGRRKEELKDSGILEKGFGG